MAMGSAGAGCQNMQLMGLKALPTLDQAPTATSRLLRFILRSFTISPEVQSLSQKAIPLLKNAPVAQPANDFLEVAGIVMTSIIPTLQLLRRRIV
jgi:hypothetical protein